MDINRLSKLALQYKPKDQTDTKSEQEKSMTSKILGFLQVQKKICPVLNYNMQA